MLSIFPWVFAVEPLYSFIPTVATELGRPVEIGHNSQRSPGDFPEGSGLTLLDILCEWSPSFSHCPVREAQRSTF